MYRVQAISSLAASRYPKAASGGVEPKIPAFPQDARQHPMRHGCAPRSTVARGSRERLCDGEDAL